MTSTRLAPALLVALLAGCTSTSMSSLTLGAFDRAGTAWTDSSALVDVEATPMANLELTRPDLVVPRVEARPGFPAVAAATVVLTLGGASPGPDDVHMTLTRLEPRFDGPLGEPAVEGPIGDWSLRVYGVVHQVDVEAPTIERVVLRFEAPGYEPFEATLRGEAARSGVYFAALRRSPAGEGR